MTGRKQMLIHLESDPRGRKQSVLEEQVVQVHQTGKRELNVQVCDFPVDASSDVLGDQIRRPHEPSMEASRLSIYPQ